MQKRRRTRAGKTAESRMASLSFEAVESHYGLIGVTPSDVPLGRVVEVAVEGLGGLLLRFLKRD